MEIPREALAIIRAASRLLAAAADPNLRALAERILAQSGEAVPSADQQANGASASGTDGSQTAATASGPAPAPRTVLMAADRAIVAIPAELLRELLAQMEAAAAKLGQVEAPRVRVPTEALREMVEAARAAGGPPDLLDEAERALQEVRETSAGRTVEIPLELLKALTGVVSRAGARLLIEESRAGGSTEAPRELAAFLRDAVRSALRLVAPHWAAEALAPGQAKPNPNSPNSLPALPASPAADGSVPQSQRVWLPVDLLREIVDSARAAGADRGLLAAAERALQTARETGDGRAAEIPADVLTELAGAIGRGGERVLAFRAPAAPTAAPRLFQPLSVLEGPAVEAQLPRAIVGATGAAGADADPLGAAASTLPLPAPNAQRMVVSADLLRVVVDGVRVAGENADLAGRAQAVIDEIPPGRLTVEADASLIRELIDELENAGARELARSPGARTARLPSALYRGVIAGLALAVEGRPTSGAEKATPSVPPPGVADPIRAGDPIQNLTKELAPRVEGDESLRNNVVQIEEALCRLAQSRPVLARQIALTLNAFARLQSADLRTGLVRAGDVLSQIASLAGPDKPTANALAPARLSEPAVAVQAVLESEPADTARVQGLFGQLRALGSRVEIGPSETRLGATVTRWIFGPANGGEPPPLTLDLRSGAAGAGAQQAIRSLLADLAALTPDLRSGAPTAAADEATVAAREPTEFSLADRAAPAPNDGPLRAEVERLGAVLRSLAQDRPLLAQQAAVALQAFVQSEPPNLQGALSRAGVLLAQILSLARPLGASAAGNAAPVPQAGTQPLIQTFMETKTENLGAIRDLLGELRALGARVEIQPSARRVGFSEIALLLGEPGAAKGARPFTLDLRAGADPARPAPERQAEAPATEAPAEPRTPLRASGSAAHPPASSGPGAEERLFPGARGLEDPGRTQTESRAGETFRPAPGPNAPSSSSHGPQWGQPDFNPFAAETPRMPVPAGSGWGAAGEGAGERKIDRLLLTYEPELTRAWQLEHFREKGSTAMAAGSRKGALLDLRLDADEREEGFVESLSHLAEHADLSGSHRTCASASATQPA